MLVIRAHRLWIPLLCRNRTRPSRCCSNSMLITRAFSIFAPSVQTGIISVASSDLLHEDLLCEAERVEKTRLSHLLWAQIVTSLPLYIKFNSTIFLCNVRRSFSDTQSLTYDQTPVKKQDKTCLLTRRNFKQEHACINTAVLIILKLS